ncbi:putative zinc-binding metallopeptidase [Paracoccus sp. MBLB3053]|uniref:Zinc-binding metallopeptidase n=1 Tax=Paracoccus aurantius TaxID=3073814 RepID=A0ABU2HNS2_9RHOB|nr:putative zinc-binding metallopeptidase [Paracoccus sp. MBLB3053]MDS9466694.1 putative zinc-binding metallopeptidase [Paracoccus sp. MBLB3053]
MAFDPDTGRFTTNVQICSRHQDIACNWRADSEGGLCRSCAMTSTIPDLSVQGNLDLLSRSEAAKRWVLANLARWNWFTTSDDGPRPVFRMLSEHAGQSEVGVTMGHADGVITINVVEADDAIRAERQQQLGELYRSMIGHMRHEIAHFLFERLAVLPGFLDEFRPLFGDERADYGEALQAHYANPKDPGETHISEYATMHPHEDWAETAAHILHLVDMTDSLMATGLSGPDIPAQGYDAYADTDADRLLTTATAVALAVNEINRALDNPDVYPFVLTDMTRSKLSFAHRWLSQGATLLPAREAQPQIALQAMPDQF